MLPAPRRGASKPAQAKPSKTKQNCLDLLGFIRPNRDFSMGYDGKNKKISSPFSSRPAYAGRRFDPASKKCIARTSGFHNQIAQKFRGLGIAARRRPSLR
jgi:hypothetical protein